ncbi:MAG: glycerophosphodiester phosphodiesterase [Clostridiales bacterium]|jgi:glycerophosphoryl diester phosphodiesterase|nr:glycerophosphodiester phosphodiesterase [Clostridiales bacterium]
MVTKIISHRGANKYAPENTIPAFQKALEFKVEGFENDVHCTKDGFVVVCHNHTIDATSNGKGKIADYTLEELRKFDFGSYFSEEFAGTKIPTLEEFLELCGGLEIINIEIKSPEKPNTDIVRKTIKLVKDFNLFDRLLISSFDPQILLECKEYDKLTKTGILYSPDVEEVCEEVCDDTLAFGKKYKLDAFHPFIMFVNDDYIEELHDAGYIVNPWICNTDFALEKLKKWGCDGAITDTPDLAAKILRA